MKTQIPFYKIHGLGNDFILMKYEDIAHLDNQALSKLAHQICNRHQGIGGDGLIIPFPSKIADIKMRIWNADGSEAEMCGNGIRCLAKFVYEEGMIAKEDFSVETLGGIMHPKLTVIDDKVEQVTVDMGIAQNVLLNQEISIDGERLTFHYCLLGVPHILIFRDDLETLDITSIGPKLEKHPIFPEGTNVNFAKQISSNEIQVRTWERGAGATLACGTGSSSVAYLSYRLGLVPNQSKIRLALGHLLINYDENNHHILMSGPASTSFKGDLEI